MSSSGAVASLSTLSIGAVTGVVAGLLLTVGGANLYVAAHAPGKVVSDVSSVGYADQ